MIADTVLLCALAVFARADIKKKELPLPALGVCAAVGVILFLTTDELSLSGVLGGMCVGGVLLLCALISRESIGIGDGLLFVVTGIYLGLWKNLILLFLAAVTCAVVGLILVLAKKCTRKKSLPFAPFVLAADLVMLLMVG